jgi:DNA-binding transcriptional ArsR family regulator
MKTLIHPIRLQIIWTLINREMTPQEIARLMPDVSQASLYRHIQKLVQIGALEVVRETPVRGTLEKVYRVVEQNINVPMEEFQTATREEHIQHFSNFITSLLPIYRAYVVKEEPKRIAHSVTYRTATLNLTSEEYEALRQKIRTTLQELDHNPPTEKTRRIFTSMVLFPETPEAERESTP